MISSFSETSPALSATRIAESWEYGRCGGNPPAEMLLAALDEDARALMDAFEVEMPSPPELDLTPGRVECERAERGEVPLAD